MLNGPDDVHVGDEQHGDEPDEHGEDTGDAVGLLPAGNDADDSPSSICAVAFAFPARARAAASTPARFRFFPPKGTPLAFAASGASAMASAAAAGAAGPPISAPAAPAIIIIPSRTSEVRVNVMGVGE